MIAEKLGDTGHIPMYMRLVKNEDRKVVMEAYRYAVECRANKSRNFLWKLKDIKENSKVNILVEYVMEEKSIKLIKKKLPSVMLAERISLKLAYISGYKKYELPKLDTFIEELKEKYSNEFTVPINSLKQRGELISCTSKAPIFFKLKSKLVKFFNKDNCNEVTVLKYPSFYIGRSSKTVIDTDCKNVIIKGTLIRTCFKQKSLI